MSVFGAVIVIYLCPPRTKECDAKECRLMSESQEPDLNEREATHDLRAGEVGKECDGLDG